MTSRALPSPLNGVNTPELYSRVNKYAKETVFIINDRLNCLATVLFVRETNLSQQSHHFVQYKTLRGDKRKEFTSWVHQALHWVFIDNNRSCL